MKRTNGGAQWWSEDKSFYLALMLCLAAIAVAAYLLFAFPNGTSDDDTMQDAHSFDLGTDFHTGPEIPARDLLLVFFTNTKLFIAVYKTTDTIIHLFFWLAIDFFMVVKKCKNFHILLQCARKRRNFFVVFSMPRPHSRYKFAKSCPYFLYRKMKAGR